MRLLEKNSKVADARRNWAWIRSAPRCLSRLVEKPHGLFLTTGPTGSGKTTTLYSILQSIYTPEMKILTIEDPVEYELPGVAQIPVRPSRNFTFATGLRSILRQDPDVVMVGEIRDSETAEIAIRAALTGHQVFSTLHTNDSTGAVTRLMDMGVEAFLISSSLEGVLAQRLVRRICPHCRRESAGRPELAGQDGGAWAAATLAGRVLSRQGARNAAAPVIADESASSNCWRSSRAAGIDPAEALERGAQERRAKTMMTMHQDALKKAAEGITSLEEILRVSSGDVIE